MSSDSRVNQLREVIYHLGKNRKQQSHGHHGIRVHDVMLLNGIRAVGNDQPVMMSKVAQHFNISAPAMSQLSRRLEKLGYIERVVGEDDRRNVYICLSEKAKQEIRDAQQKMDETLSGVIAAIGTEDSDELIRILDKVRIYLETRERK